MLVALNLNLVKDQSQHYIHRHFTAGLKVLCVVHSHVDGVRLQRSIAEILCVVLLHAVIVLPDHIRSRRGAIEPHLGPVTLRRAAAAVLP